MRFGVFGLAVLLTLCGAAAQAMTAEEVVKLKQAGVSDATIQKMLELEGVKGDEPGKEQNGSIVYQAGSKNAERRKANQEHERWKEEKSMDAVQGVILDSRRPNSGGDGQTQSNVPAESGDQ